MHPAIIIGTVRSLIVDVAMGQIPRFTERISSYVINSSISGTELKLVQFLLIFADFLRKIVKIVFFNRTANGH